MPPEDLCKQCNMAPVKECLNGNIVVDDFTAKECPNFKRIRIEAILRSRLTVQLYNAPVIKESPLYTPAKVRGEPAIVNRTKENLFITGVTYGGLLPHLRLVFACLPIRYKIVEDSRIRDVFVGAEAYKSKSSVTREQKESYNVVADLVGSDFDLVIIRLGILAYKNVAAPAILREALMVREGLGKSTWLFEDADPTIHWICSRDEDLEAYIKPRFHHITLDDTGPSADVSTDISVDGPEEEEGVSEYYAYVPETDRGAASVVEADPFANDPSFGGGPPKFKKKWGKR